MRYMEMLKSAEFRDDLDVVSTVHTPKGIVIFLGLLKHSVGRQLHFVTLVKSMPFYYWANYWSSYQEM